MVSQTPTNMVHHHEHHECINWLLRLPADDRPGVIPLIIPLSTNATTEQTTTHEIVTHIALDVKEAQDNLLAAKICQAYYTNKYHAPEDIYEVGDLVMLSTENHHCNYKHKGKTCVAKFMPWNDGPYTVTHTPSWNTLSTHSNY